MEDCPIFFLMETPIFGTITIAIFGGLELSIFQGGCGVVHAFDIDNLGPLFFKP
jgi:hypothetical protein